MARSSFSGPVASANGFLTTAATSGKSLTLKAPAALSADTVLTFPNGAGSNGQQLTTDGTGNLSWTSAGGSGTVTSVGGTGTINGLTLSGTVTSSGSLTLGGQFALAESTKATLEDIAAAPNTTGKYQGKLIVDISSGLIYVATGPDAGDIWRASDGTTTATPI